MATNNLEQDLLKDLSVTKQKQEQTESALGVAAPKGAGTDTAARAERSSKRSIGASQLKDLERGFGLALDHFKNESVLLDDVQKSQLEADLRKRFNNAKRIITTRGLDFERMAIERGIGRETKQAMAEMFFKTMSSGAELGFSEAGGGDPGGELSKDSFVDSGQTGDDFKTIG